MTCTTDTYAPVLIGGLAKTVTVLLYSYVFRYKFRKHKIDTGRRGLTTKDRKVALALLS